MINETYCNGIAQSPYMIYTDFFTLLQQYCSKKSLITLSQRRDFLQWCCNIFQKPAVIHIFFELMVSRADTPLIIKERTGLPQRTVYWVLGELLSMGLIVKTRSLKTNGRPTIVYALYDHTPDDVIEAVQRDMIARTPAYTEVQRIMQIVLDEYLPLLNTKGYKEIYTAEIMAIIKKDQKGFISKDLYQPVIKNLRYEGVPVVNSPEKRIL